MELNHFKDKLFDLLNDGSDELGIADIDTHDRDNSFVITTTEVSLFEIRCNKLMR